MGFEQILALISSDPEKALILLEKLWDAGKLTKDLFKKAAKKVRDAQKRKVFGCTPSDKLANNLRRIDTTETYKELKKLIGDHHSLRLARIGLYLETLNKEGKTLVVDQIRDEIFQNHREAGLQYLDIGSSGLMTEVIDSLKKLQREFNLPQHVLIRRYEYIIRTMRYITSYINNNDHPVIIREKILKQLNRLPEQFFIIGTGIASDNTMKVIAEMNNVNIFRDKGYIIFPPNIRPHGEDRKQYIWTFTRYV